MGIEVFVLSRPPNQTLFCTVAHLGETEVEPVLRPLAWVELRLEKPPSPSQSEEDSVPAADYEVWSCWTSWP